MARFGVKEVMDVTFYKLNADGSKGEPELFLDTLKMSNLENGAETVYATGGSGAPRLIGWDFNRTATFTVQDALLNPKAIAMQTGVEAKKGTQTIYARERHVVDAGAIALKNTPKGAVTLYLSEDGYEHTQKLEVTTDYTVTDQAVTLTSATDGDVILAYYDFETDASAELLTISSSKFGGYYMVVGDTLWRNEASGADEPVQIIIPRAKISSAFTLTMQPDGDPSVFDFNLDVFKDSRSDDMVKIIRY